MGYKNKLLFGLVFVTIFLAGNMMYDDIWGEGYRETYGEAWERCMELDPTGEAYYKCRQVSKISAESEDNKRYYVDRNALAPLLLFNMIWFFVNTAIIVGSYILHEWLYYDYYRPWKNKRYRARLQRIEAES